VASAELIGAAFRERFGSAPAVVASAPGRVNLIGEHTDYNDGFALPMAIGARAFVAMAPAGTAPVRLHSAQFDGPGSQWHAIPGGVLREFALLGAEPETVSSPACALRIPGEIEVDVLIDSDVPVGSGLASSAAVEMALARALCDLAGRTWIPLEMARLGQRVEHAAGVMSGLMDQTIAAGAREGFAMLLDCRTLDARPVRMPAGLAVVVMDSGVRRTLGASEYNARRTACEDAVTAIRAVDDRVRALRDVDTALLARAARVLTPLQLRRARHVVTENARVAAFADALDRGDARAAGSLLDESHASLRDDYEVSSVHLDTLCELARAHPASVGARLTGAGFGGCAIALVAEHAVGAFVADVQPLYEAATYQRARFFSARPGAGARIDARTGRPAAPAAG
jgi:galactokinase